MTLIILRHLMIQGVAGMNIRYRYNTTGVIKIILTKSHCNENTPNIALRVRVSGINGVEG
jgi:hypothetical protein